MPYAPKKLCKKRWQANLDALAKFKNKFGHCNVPFNYFESPELGRWVKRQRFNYRLMQKGDTSKTHITEERIRVLEDLGMVWDLHEVQWQKMYKLLTEYHQANGHVNVPIKEPQLGMWVSNQRSQLKLYKTGKSSSMTVKRYQALMRLGFQWEIKPWHTKSKPSLSQLKSQIERKCQAIEKIDATVMKPTKNKTAKTSLSELQRKYLAMRNSIPLKDASMTEAKKEPMRKKEPISTTVTTIIMKSSDDVPSCEELSTTTEEETMASTTEEELSPASTPASSRPSSPTAASSSSRAASLSSESSKPASSAMDSLLLLSVLSGEENKQWSKHVQKLEEFKRKHGHCNVPLKAHDGLGPWVKRQRYQYKLYQKGEQANMTEDRIRILEDIGFVWDLHETQWNKMFDELKAYKAKNGHCDVPISAPSLGTWVTYQRYLYRLLMEGKPSCLSIKRKDRLESIDFRWEVRGQNHVKRGRKNKMAKKNITQRQLAKMQNNIKQQETELLAKMQSTKQQETELLLAKMQSNKPNHDLLSNNANSMLMAQQQRLPSPNSVLFAQHQLPGQPQFDMTAAALNPTALNLLAATLNRPTVPSFNNPLYYFKL
mmetsp:Transcript_27298/g.40299  ORF Transcript_27298/g.40299 Transcript_27298/m.40299 type:complete len:600 (-) Transcript_27298:42-1841(-)